MIKQVIIFILILVTMTLATNNNRYERAIDNYLVALKSDNIGLIESAIYNVVQLKMAYTDLDFSSIVAELSRLTNDVRVGEKIRNEAKIALVVFRQKK